MEKRKETEIEYYEKKAAEQLGSAQEAKRIDFEGFNPFLLSSYKFLQQYLKDKCKGKKILDYGCGNGVHSFWLADCGGDITGVDLSEKSLEIAKKRARREKSGSNVKFLVQDCEKLEFPDNYFDIIFDGGSFSSLDLKNAFPGLVRVLKSSGFLVGIETFGHNPFTNFKRQLNKVFGKRTSWAASHIFSLKDIELAKEFFGSTDVYYFHVISWLAIPFLRFDQSGNLVNFLEKIDKILLRYPFIKKYSFKVVFVFSNPKK
jgi:SAM-dependent methyltransferase